MNTDVILGWFLGVASSILSGIVLFWLQAHRDAHLEQLRQRREDVRMVRNWAHSEKKASLRGFDVAGANLSGYNLSSADLEDTNFEKAFLHDTKLHHANLRGANFQKAKLVRAVLKEANLRGADFTGATLRGVDFTEAILQKVKFQGVKIEAPCVWTSVVIDESTDLDDTLRAEIQKAQAQQ